MEASRVVKALGEPYELTEQLDGSVVATFADGVRVMVTGVLATGLDPRDLDAFVRQGYADVTEVTPEVVVFEAHTEPIADEIDREWRRDDGFSS